MTQERPGRSGPGHGEDPGVSRWEVTRTALIDALASVRLAEHLTLDARGRLADEILGGLPSAGGRPSPEQMLREFHAAGGDAAGPVPAVPTGGVPNWVQELRMKLLDEETGELSEAVIAGDIVEIADALADIVYVAVGIAISSGIPFDAVFREVHRSNMTKFIGGPVTNTDGKIVKGPHYEPPDIAGVLSAAAGEPR
jgi:hypothetical protein